jgi:hypothetical protein
MKKIIIASLLAALPALPMAVVAADPPAKSAPAYSSADTPIGDLLDNPAARAILDKYLPGFSKAEQIDAARGMTLRAVQPYATDTVTDEALAKIDAELAKLPAPK